jgi:hypothetical protein
MNDDKKAVERVLELYSVPQKNAAPAEAIQQTQDVFLWKDARGAELPPGSVVHELQAGDADARRSRTYTTPRGVTVEIPAGHKVPPLPPALEPGSGPSAEAERVVKEAASAYHLDTLRRLEEESRQPGLTPEEEELLRPATPAVFAQGVRDAAGAALAELVLPAGMTRGAGSGTAQKTIDDIERVRMEHLGRDLARKFLSGEDLADDEELGERLDRAVAAMVKPCGSAACRTLRDCLCSCSRCRDACAGRRRG